MKLKLLSLGIILSGATASAMTFDWSGQYRFEYTQVSAPTLSTPTGQKAYGLNYLALSPHIIASDGINVYSQFQVLPNTQYLGSQLGQVWGENTTTPVTNSTNQGQSNIAVNELYAKIIQEYGVITVGRAPFEFGLGMTYHAGRGEFDHWKTTKDIVSYKFISGDWSVMPVISKVKTGGYGLGNSISTIGAMIGYDNEDSKTKLAVYQESRKGVGTANDLDFTAYGADASQGRKDLDISSTNIFFGRDFSAFGFKLEAGFQSGGTGLKTTGGEEVKLGGYGVATEFYQVQEAPRFQWKVKMGIAAGDNTDSATYEAYAFHRNYDLAMLIFNQRLGQKDFFQTDAVKNSSLGNESADDETVSNAYYIAPTLSHFINDQFEMQHSLIYAQLVNTIKSSVDSKKDLGLEYDLAVVYKPTDRVKWVNSIGFLVPGSAWKNGTSGFDSNTTYGFVSKATISF